MNAFRSLAKRLPHPLLCRLYHYRRLREETARVAKAASLTGLPLLQTLNLANLRLSETLFILGSAGSINEISAERWQVIAKHDSVGINFWPAHPFVPRFYHFENIAYEEQPAMYIALRDLLARRAEAYSNTLKIITEVEPIGRRQLVFEIPEAMRKHFYIGFSMPVVARNEEELGAGIRFMETVGAFNPQYRASWLFKYGGSAIGMLALAVVMGYKRVVMCGVDLNKQVYFYQDQSLYPECSDWEFASREKVHLTARRYPWLVPAPSAIQIFKEVILDPAKIQLFVESRESALYPNVPLAPRSLFEELTHPGAQSRTHNKSDS
jgi:hypothetical protein